MLSATSISYRIGEAILLQNTSLQLEEGRFHVIMGPNGAGKSTLLTLLAGELPPDTGDIQLKGKNLKTFGRKELAQHRAVLSQHYHLSFPILVQDIVLMGRYPFFGRSPSLIDHDICRQAMESMGVYEFRDRDYSSLSGGEAQKVQMSRVLSQIWETSVSKPKLLFLDEPVSHLDIRYQFELLKAARDLCKRHTTVIAVLHDINLAMAFAHRIIFMKKGSVVVDTDKPEQISPEIIHSVFDVQASILYPDGHRPVVVF
jgi:iron complex transport system ATP-binding protein